MINSINYINGDVTQLQGDGPKVLVHIVNDVGAWNAGVVLDISRRWPETKARYRDWWLGNFPELFQLGAVQFCDVEENLWVANLVGQHGIKGPSGIPPIRYGSVVGGLNTVAKFAHHVHASVHMPRIGCDLAGGSWDIVEKLILQTLIRQGIEVIVYDMPKRRR